MTVWESHSQSWCAAPFVRVLLLTETSSSSISAISSRSLKDSSGFSSDASATVQSSNIYINLHQFKVQMFIPTCNSSKFKYLHQSAPVQSSNVYTNLQQFKVHIFTLICNSSKLKDWHQLQQFKFETIPPICNNLNLKRWQQAATVQI